MTKRARVLVLMALLGLCIGTARNQVLFSLVSLSVIVWILAEWIRFRTWIDWTLPRVQFQRLVNDRAGDDVLWAGRKVRMEVRVTSPRPIKIEMRLRDFVPEMLEIVSPDPVPGKRPTGVDTLNDWNRAFTSPVKTPWLADLWDRWTNQIRAFFIDAETPTTRQETFMRIGTQSTSLSYTAYLPSAGRISLPGVRLVLEDMYGLFREHRFREFPRPIAYCLATTKRANCVPRSSVTTRSQTWNPSTSTIWDGFLSYLSCASMSLVIRPNRLHGKYPLVAISY